MSRILPADAWMARTRAGRIAAFVICIGLIGFMVNTWVIDRYELVVTVEDARVPVTCNRSKDGLFRRHPRQRDFEPDDAPDFFCGLVWTDHGPFKLPQTHDMPLVQTDRATLVRSLRAGCRYRIKVVSTGVRPDTDPEQERKVGRIIRNYEALGCD